MPVCRHSGSPELLYMNKKLWESSVHRFGGICMSSVISWSKRGNGDFNVKRGNADFNVQQENMDF